MNEAVEAVPTFLLAPVKQHGKWGFIDPAGNVVIGFQFDQVKPFSEGLAAVNVGAWQNEDGWIERFSKVLPKYKEFIEKLQNESIGGSPDC